MADARMSWEARDADVPGIARLLGQLGYATTSEQAAARIAALDAKSHVIVVERVEGEVVAFGAARVDRTLQRDAVVGRIIALAVDPDHQGQGRGTRIVRRLEGWARDLGAASMTVNSADRRRRAHRWYRSRGYERTGARFGRSL